MRGKPAAKRGQKPLPAHYKPPAPRPWEALLRPIGSVVPYDRNPRRNEAGVAKVARSIAEFGWQQPIVVDEAGVVIAGHTRLLAARSLGLAEVPVRVAAGLSPDQVRAYRLADNRAGQDAEWDDELLAGELAALQLEEFDLALTGFDPAEIDGLLNPNGGILPGVDPDEVPEPPTTPITKPGDLILLGKHRLLCGDSTKAEDVARLMEGERASACITDPPYSVNYDKSQEQRGGNATVHGAYHEAAIDPSDLLTFMALVPSDVMIWSYPVDRHFRVLADAYESHGWEFKKELVWVKDSFSFWMSAKYQQKHEPIMLAVRSGCAIGGDIPANATTVFEFPRPRAHELHPTAKPVDLWAIFVEYHVPPSGIVFDPFLGSGTTIVAAEKLGRACYGLELSPAYCDVICQRWQNATGQQAVRP